MKQVLGGAGALAVIGVSMALALVFWASPAVAHHRPWHQPTPTPTVAVAVTATPAVTATRSVTPTATVTPTPPGGARWFLHGANYAWWNYGTDFGHPANGVAANRATHDSRFALLRSNGGKVIRWWLFPQASEGWGTVQLGQAPAPAVYTDLDAAVQLAAQHDLYLHFTFLNYQSDLDYIVDAARAQATVDQTFRPILRRYGQEPRILSWDAMNEPDWPLERDTSKVPGFQNYVRLLANAVHAETQQKITVGAGFPKYRDWYRGLGLDFYTFHRYDWTAPYPDCCDVLAHPASYWGMDKPIVVGEFQDVGSSLTGDKYERAWTLGYAGAWPWSMNPERTGDKHQVDWPTFRAFAQRHAAEWRLR